MPRSLLLFSLLPLALTELACRASCSYERGELDWDDRPLDSALLDLEDMPSLALEEGESGGQPRFDLDEDGTFTLHRSVESDYPHLGFEVEDLSVPDARAAGLTEATGVHIRRVAEHAAGILPGDIVLAVDSLLVHSSLDFESALETLPPGSRTKVTLWRDRQEVEVELPVERLATVVGSRSYEEAFPQLDDFERTGLRYLEIPEQFREAILGKSAQGALLVSELLNGGPAFYSDLRVADVLLSVNGQPVPTSESYREILDSVPYGERIQVKALRRGRPVEAEIQVVEDSRDESYVNLAGLLTYGSKAERTKFSLLFGMLMNYRNCRSVVNNRDHIHKTDWGMLLDLFEYRSRPGRVEIDLLWIFDLEFGA